jgi:hypothetical protein
MDRKPVPRRLLVILMAALLLLPIAAWAVVAVGGVLGLMGDSEGQILLNRLAWGCGILWMLDLVSLVVIHTIAAISDGDKPE